MSDEPENLNQYLNSLPGISYRSHEFVNWVDADAESVDPKEAYENDDYEEWEGFSTNTKNNNE